MKDESKYKALACLYCDGYKYACRNYTPMGSEHANNPELCVYYSVVDHDLEKVKEHTNGDFHAALTFESLEKIIRKGEQ